MIWHLAIHTRKASVRTWNSGFQEKDQLLGGDAIHNQTSTACGQANCVSSFLFFNIDTKTLGHTMILSDLLDVELYIDNVKMSNHETLPASGINFDEHSLEKFEQQVDKSTLMKHAMTLHQEDFVLKKEPRSDLRLRTMVNVILEQQQHTLRKELM